MSYPKEFCNLLQTPSWNQHYVGLGNPASDILIIGKECATNRNDVFYKYEYSRNYELWTTKDKDRSVDKIDDCIVHGKPVFDLFDPLAPYKGQCFKIDRKNNNNGGTSTTWYNYQKLMNLIRGKDLSDKQTIDFYESCFITELNETCRENNIGLSKSERRNTEENIRLRFDLMRETREYWSRFKAVILACGHYADALRHDQALLSSIFCEKSVIMSLSADGRMIPQLSIGVSNQMLIDIAEQVRARLSG